jgi:hypothetical protein
MCFLSLNDINFLLTQDPQAREDNLQVDSGRRLPTPPRSSPTTDTGRNRSLTPGWTWPPTQNRRPTTTPPESPEQRVPANSTTQQNTATVTGRSQPQATQVTRPVSNVNAVASSSRLEGLPAPSMPPDPLAPTLNLNCDSLAAKTKTKKPASKRRKRNNW